MMKHHFLLVLIGFAFFQLKATAQNEEYYDYFLDSVMRLNQPQAGIDFFQQELKLYPKNETVLRSLGALYTQKEDYKSCISVYQKALEINPSCGLCYFYIAQSTANETKDAKQVMKIIEDGIKAAPKEGSLYLLRGKLKIVQGNEVGGLNDYYKAILIDSTEAITYIERGQYYKQKNYLDLAARDFATASRLEPENIYILNELAKVYAQDGNTDLALKVTEKALKLTRENVDTWMIEGETNQIAYNFEASIVDFQNALRLDPENAYAEYRLSESYYRVENMDGFCSSIKKSIALSRKRQIPQDEFLDFLVAQQGVVCDTSKSSYYYNRGIAEFNKKNYEKSLYWHNLAMSKFPNENMLHHFRANTNLESHHYRDALDDYLVAISDLSVIRKDFRLDGKYKWISEDSMDFVMTGFLWSNYIAMARGYYNLGKIDSASHFLNLYQTTITPYPEFNDLRVKMLEALVNNDLKQIPLALKNMEVLAQTGVRDPMIPNFMTWLYLQQAANMYFSHDQPGIASAIDVASLKWTLPKKLKVKDNEAFAAAQKQNEKALEMDPENPEALFFKGLFDYLKGVNPSVSWNIARKSDYKVVFAPYNSGK